MNARPKIVAVELPGALEDVYLQALARLPEMSVILYPDPQDDERAIYVPVEPCDPFTEAVRTALEIDAEVIFIEPDLGDRPHLPDTYPDPYSIRYIGLNKYIEAYRVYPQARNEEIAAHAAGMAWKLQGADPLAPVLAVGVAESAGSVAGRDGGARRTRRRSATAARDPAAESASGLSGRDHHRISVSAGSLRDVSRGHGRRMSWSIAPRSSSICCARPRKNTSRTPATRSSTGSAA